MITILSIINLISETLREMIPDTEYSLIPIIFIKRSNKQI